MQECQTSRRAVTNGVALLRRAPLVAATAVAGAILAAPAGAAAPHPSASVVAWHVLELANRTLASTGTPRAERVQVVVCAPRAYPRYSCRGTFADGSRLRWPHVTLTDAGALSVGANTVG
jgi:hypothetical protein